MRAVRPECACIVQVGIEGGDHVCGLTVHRESDTRYITTIYKTRTTLDNACETHQQLRKS